MGKTSIPCDSAVRDELSELKPEGTTWSEYLQTLADGDDPPVRRGVGVSEEVIERVEDVHDDLKDLHVLLDRLPERTADELEARQR